MAKLVVAIILFAVGGVAARVLASLAATPRWERASRLLRLGSAIAITLGIAVPLLIILFSTFKVIPAGHVGVASLFGKVQSRPLPEGLNLINPLIDVVLMSTQVQRRSEKYDAASQDLQAVHVEM